MPSFAGMCANNAGLEMPIFLMLYSDDNESGQVGTTLYTTIKVVFQNIGIIWPNTIVIDKDMAKRIALIKPILEDALFWPR